jgi:hypothetical protein
MTQKKLSSCRRSRSDLVQDRARFQGHQNCEVP